MKRFLFFSFIYVLSSYFAFSQGQWVWMNGNNYPNAPGVYGTNGVPSKNNTPGARYEACEWTDLNGNFWLYGGYTLEGSLKVLNDLWRFNPSTYEWTWMHGSANSVVKAVYGTKGQSSPANTPGSRGWGIPTWVDLNGDLWLFGGDDSTGGGNLRNDLWRYDILKNEWAWEGGSNLTNQFGVYGTKEVFSPTNIPGGRSETSCSWVSNDGHFWLFGGQGNSISTGLSNYLNDLWEFDPSTKQWAWISGDNTNDQRANYGTLGVASGANKPGARTAYTNWKDKDGNLWLFGGSGYTKNKKGRLNDLWKFDIDPSSASYHQWTWVNGTDSVNHPGSYGTKCLEDTSNIPASRTESRAEWIDDCGNFWFYGGSSGSAPGSLGDLWKYNVQKNQFIWVSGDAVEQQVGSFGIKNTPSANNKPGGKQGAVSWQNKDGLWLFGGYIPKGNNVPGANWGNDLWKYSDIPSVDFDYSFTGNCIVTFTNTSTSCIEMNSTLWDFGDPTSGTDNTSSSDTPTHQFYKSGTYQVTLSLVNCFGAKNSLTKPLTINHVLDAGKDVSIILGDSASLNATGGTLYSWSPSATLSCSNCSNPMAGPASTTTYYVSSLDADNCNDIDSVVVFVFRESDTFFPNAFTPDGDGLNDSFKITTDLSTLVTFQMQIFDRWGELIYEGSDINEGWDGKYKEIECSEGIYLCKVVYKNDKGVKEKTSHIALIR